MQRQGQVGPDGEPVASPRPPARAANATRTAPRGTPFSYFRDVRNELRKVAWPTKSEVRNYSMVVLITVVFLIALIFVIDYAATKAAIWLFK